MLRLFGSKVRVQLRGLSTGESKTGGGILKTRRKREAFEQSESYLKVLGSGANGAPAAVGLKAGKKKFLFNCGEGLTRLGLQSSGYCPRFQHVFVTQADWRHIGGLMTLAIEMGSAHIRNFFVYGPNPICEFLKTMKSTLDVKAELNFIAPKTGSSYEDSSIRIEGIPIHNSKSKDASSVMAYICEVKPSPNRSLGRIFAVVDVPSIDYLPSVMGSETLWKNANTMELVVHFSPQNVIEHPNYQQFIRSFSARHLIVNEENKFSGFVAAHKMQRKLNVLDEHLFPLLKEPIPERSVQNQEVPDASSMVNKIERASPGTIYKLQPEAGISRDREWVLDHTSYQLAEEYEGKASKLPGGHEEYPKIVFLGTGSSKPGGTRSASAILVHTTSNACILLDCAEGTIGQISRFYGNETPEVLRKLRAIYVSHRHPDHHLGVIGVLKARRQCLTDVTSPVCLFAPPVIEPYLDFYHQHLSPLYSDFDFVSNTSLTDPEPFANKATADLGLASIQTCFVKHCFESFGVTFTINAEPPFKITYSGDCLPSIELLRIGMDSTVLIHEATFEDEMAEVAARKYHSTVSQAIDQGQRMNAKHIILTHFSQRYPAIPRILSPLPANISIAFDNMQLVESDLREMHEMYPTLKRLFSDDWAKMERLSSGREDPKGDKNKALLSLLVDKYS